MSDVISAPTPAPNRSPWSLHDDPDRPLDEFVGICACVICVAALQTQAAIRPSTPIALKTEADRIVVALEYLAEVMRHDRTLTSLLYVVGDRVRSLYVPVDGWPMRGRRRWWSLSCHEDDSAARRRHARHQVAKRQSTAARQRAIERARAEAPPPPPVGVEVEFASLAEVVAPFRRRHRQLIAQVRRHALTHGQPLDDDVVAFVLGVRETPLLESRRLPIDRWTRRDVIDFLSVDAFNWCSQHRILLPDQVPEALWHLLGLLAATDALHDVSDPLDELRKPLRCYGVLDATGRRYEGDDESGRDRCECYVTYRGPLHGELRDAVSRKAPA